MQKQNIKKTLHIEENSDSRLVRLIFSRFFDIHRNLGNVKDKPNRKTCFSREMKRLAWRIYLTKFC